jgi:multidrug resistance efflux pump
MNRSRPEAPRPRLRLTIWVVGVLAASSAALTIWGLYSRADGPSADAPSASSPSGQRYNFLGLADLEQGVTPLYPLQPGRVLKVLAKDGDAVDEGEPLLTLDDQRATLLVAQAQAGLTDAQLQLDDAKKLPALHQAQVDGQTQAVEARMQEAAAARAKADEAHRLNKSETKAVSDESARAAEAQALAAEAAAKGEEAKLRALELDDASIKLKRAEQGVVEKQRQLDEAQLGLRECTVRAPVKGVVERMLVSMGETLGPNPQQPAVMFAADGPRIIRAEVEQEWAGHVALNMTAAVQDYSTAGPTWHGRVTRLSDWYTHRRSMLLEPLQFNDVRTLECIVTLDPGQQLLRIGQRVRVTLEGGS